MKEKFHFRRILQRRNAKRSMLWLAAMLIVVVGLIVYLNRLTTGM